MDERQGWGYGKADTPDMGVFWAAGGVFNGIVLLKKGLFGGCLGVVFEEQR
jgi:hypothetical protein